VGWREITAAGHGVHLVHPPVPARSVSHSLRAYPAALLGPPPDQRWRRLRAEPGNGPGAGATIHLSRGDPVSRWVAAADRKLEGLVGGALTPLRGALPMLLRVGARRGPCNCSRARARRGTRCTARSWEDGDGRVHRWPPRPSTRRDHRRRDRD